MSHDGRRPVAPPVARAIATTLVWAAVIAVAAALCVVRTRAAVTAGQPDFDGFFLPAAKAVAAGGSPYSVDGYYYPPLLAILLAPASHATWVLGAWTVLRVVCACVAAFVAVLAFTPRKNWLLRGLFTGFAIVTLLYSWPATLELWAGQPNMLVLLSLTCTALAVAHGKSVITGLALGMAAVVKGWPGLFVIWLFRCRVADRAKTWLGVVLAAALAVGMALVVGGGQTVVDMLLSPLRGGDQQLLAANSVWGIARMLFSRTPMGAPLTVSPTLHTITVAVLTAAVIGSLALALIRPGSDELSLFNVAFAVILLLPVSHFFYLLIVLPVFWWWIIRVARTPHDLVPWIVAVVQAAWWVACFRFAPAGDGFMTTTWESLLRIFGTSLLACVASIIGAAILDHREARRSITTSASAVRHPRAYRL